MRHDDSVREFLRIFRRHRVLIFVVVVVALVAGAAYSFVIATPTYVASAAIKFTGVDQDLARLGAIVVPDSQPDKVAATNVNAPFEPEVIGQIVKQLDRLKISTDVGELRDSVRTHVDPESNLVVIDGKSPSPQIAQRLANTTAQVTLNVETRIARRSFADQADALDARLSALRSESKGSEQNVFSAVNALQDQLAKLQTLSQIARPVELVREATLPTKPSSPRPLRDMLLAAFVGLILALGAAIARETFDRRVHSSDEIQELLDLPVIGYVREVALGQSVPGVNDGEPMDDRDVESFRILRANLGFLDVDQLPRTVIVTSALPEEGKSSVAASLAQASAAAGTKTLLVECDLRRPTLAGRLGLSPEPGLTDYLGRQLDRKEVVQHLDLPSSINGNARIVDATGLDIVTAGSRSPQPAETLGSDRFKEFLASAAQEYELVVLDSCPLLSVVDTRELVPLMDAVLLCTRVSRTTRDQMLAAKAALEHFPGLSTAVVVTGMRPRDEPDYGYYSYAY